MADINIQNIDSIDKLRGYFVNNAGALAAKYEGDRISKSNEEIINEAIDLAIKDMKALFNKQYTKKDIMADSAAYDKAVTQAITNISDVQNRVVTSRMFVLRHYDENGKLDNKKNENYIVLPDGVLQKRNHYNSSTSKVLTSVLTDDGWKEKDITNSKEYQSSVEKEDTEEEKPDKEDTEEKPDKEDTEKDPDSAEESDKSPSTDNDQEQKKQEDKKILLTTDHSAENARVSSFNDGYLLASAADPLKSFSSYVNHTGQKRYYSSTDVRIATGDGEFLTEIVTISWTLQEKKMPLFGYNSYTFDEMAIGSRMIQGTFVINFVVPDYLHQVITKNETDASSNSNIYACNGEVTSKCSNISAYEYLPRDFTICLGYGGDTSGSNKQENAQCHVFFEHVYIESQGQMVAEDGTPVYEQYSFIARDTRYTK